MTARLSLTRDTALVVIDVQGEFEPGAADPGIPAMTVGPPYLDGVLDLVRGARGAGVPVVFIQEVHKRTLTDIGRELDGAEGVHCLEGDPSTELSPGLDPGPDEYIIRKRRYSAFFATELLLVLRSLRVQTVILVGGLTDVCVHYTAVDAHQHDFHIRVVRECVYGSSWEAHEASLAAMNYLQRDAVIDARTVLDDFARAATRRIDDSNERKEK